MPFKSKRQRGYCWYLYNKAKKSGKNPKWDCVEFSKSKRTRKKRVMPRRRRRRRRRTRRTTRTRRHR